MLQPAVVAGAPAARIRLEQLERACSACAAGCGNEARRELLLSGAALRAAGAQLPEAAGPVRVSVARHGLNAAAGVLFGLPVVALLAGSAVGEGIAGQAGGMLLGYAGLLLFVIALPRLAPRLLGWLAFKVDAEEPERRAQAAVPSSDQISQDTVI